MPAALVVGKRVLFLQVQISENPFGFQEKLLKAPSQNVLLDVLLRNNITLMKLHLLTKLDICESYISTVSQWNFLIHDR